MDRKNMIITGGTGFIGRNLIDRLSAEYRCINLGRNENRRCENVFWNLCNELPYGILSSLPLDCIVHSAAIVGNDNHIHPADYIEVNVKATLRLLEFASQNQVKHFIYISTGSVYGESWRVFTEEDSCSPKDIYSLSKYFSEMICKLYEDSLNITILRPFFPYGTGQSNRLIPNLIGRISSRQPVHLNENGLPCINPVNITDMTGIISETAKRGITGVFNISGEELLTIRDICEIIGRKLNVDGIRYVFTQNRAQGMVGSNRKICDLLDYKMQVNMNEGLEEMLAHCRKEQKAEG